MAIVRPFEFLCFAVCRLEGHIYLFVNFSTDKKVANISIIVYTLHETTPKQNLNFEIFYGILPKMVEIIKKSDHQIIWKLRSLILIRECKD